MTDRLGESVFETIYPGWYQGRALHIHIKAFVGERVCHTGQIFLPESISQQVAQYGPYKKQTVERMRQEDDWIYLRQGGKRSMATVALRPDTLGYIASIVMIVDA